MNPYKHQQMRKVFDLSWREEYLLGLLDEFGDCKTSFINTAAQGDGVYTHDNAKKTVLRLVDKGFVIRERYDGRTNIVKLTQKGRDFLKHIKELYK